MNPRHVLLICGLFLALPGAARADVGAVSVHAAAGYRHTITHEKGGLDLRFGMGLHLGPLGLTYELGWTNDTTFGKKENRLANRSMNWLSLQVRIPLGPVGLVLGGGGGLGWIKAPGKAEEVGGRQPYHAVHEYVIIEIPMADAFFFGIRIEPQHMWQKAVLPGVDHGIAINFLWGIRGVPR